MMHHVWRRDKPAGGEEVRIDDRWEVQNRCQFATSGICEGTTLKQKSLFRSTQASFACTVFDFRHLLGP